ncbi:hypothetical protein K491DRAFT_339645 [Lophiostoma macrostomum CBS 122681]|uniref:Uncharacterized protein n=1 Tax=Lophiostoma macrostomum CBS 122681 TaxID=1314788 RepID=A0A6A6TTV3_9PLEO|nr:hypothetical protein K491DRAFT_339645 [Lophiostoma macrostomum CBS 122681]
MRRCVVSWSLLAKSNLVQVHGADCWTSERMRKSTYEEFHVVYRKAQSIRDKCNDDDEQLVNDMLVCTKQIMR